MQYDKRQFLDMAEEVDQQNREGMRTIKADLSELHFGEVADRFRESRRDFFKKAAVGGGLAVGSSVIPLSRLMPVAFAQDSGAPSDADLAMFAQSFELAAVQAYMAAAQTGKLDETATAVGTLFAEHHQMHADAFGAILGADAVTEPNQAILDEFGPMIQNAADQAAILNVAYQVEEAAASTYFFGLGVLGQDAAQVVATILPVESGHAATLGTVLMLPTDQYLPAFTSEEQALDPAQYPVS